MILKSIDIQDALKLLNIQDNSLKFTLETEIDGELPFLDLKITRKSNKLIFGIYIENQHIQNVTLSQMVTIPNYNNMQFLIA